MIKQFDRDLAAACVQRNILTHIAAEKYLAEAQSSHLGFGDYLVRYKILTEREVMSTAAVVLGLEVIDLKNTRIEADVVNRVPVRFAWYFKFMPIRIEQSTLTIAASSPVSVKLQDEIRAHLGFKLRVVLALESEINDALNKYYGLAADTVARLAKEEAGRIQGAGEQEPWVENLEQETDDASIAKLVNQILLEAYKKRATDIHIEPYREKVRIRYRIDGVLMDANIPPGVKNLIPAVLSRIKIMANLSIVEKRLPQDGSVVVKTKDQDLDMRISTVPTPRGESMVIRILPTTTRLLSLEKLGLDEKHLQTLRSLVQKPNGIILVTGPTGSGKTTTLYACLNEINAPHRKIITLEDPVECEMEGITQLQVNPQVKFDFATGLRSVLRHDPDIIMVGEIRDMETAEIAIRTALTGHVVFSTLHTNDAASGITRIVEMGVEPYLVASSVQAFIAQRLVRVICPQCREEDLQAPPELKEEIMKSLNISDPQLVRFYKGRGCDYCSRTGFYGRTAIYEILIIDDFVRTAVLAKQRADYIKKTAMMRGMLSLRQDGWKKVIAGVTSFSEVIHITSPDEDLADLSPRENGEVEKRVRIVDDKILSKPNEYDSRAYPRISEQVGIRYAVVRQDEQSPEKVYVEKFEHSSITKDIGAGGVRFVSAYALRVGTIIELKIQIEKDKKSIDCLAKVCRVEDDTLSSMYNVVAYYLDISSADRVSINNFVKKKLEERNH